MFTRTKKLAFALGMLAVMVMAACAPLVPAPDPEPTCLAQGVDGIYRSMTYEEAGGALGVDFRGLCLSELDTKQSRVVIDAYLMDMRKALSSVAAADSQEYVQDVYCDMLLDPAVRTTDEGLEYIRTSRVPQEVYEPLGLEAFPVDANC